ncbi:oligosaccharide repeat unit polymerase [Geomonas sp. RF6]|uniref:O-antigen polymerase n=1 Tax=Geomonas sp. RF6 TaxID=2897342 RepID=UPI001E5F9C32|nr:O-antigen polymerase [Geomonas sp. RF6]UFS71305.1 oligosaccharide repeat unit polymerase [Geomonas sp. RF6]
MNFFQNEYLILCYLFGLLLVMNYLVGRRDILYPGFVYSALWTTIVVLYAFSPVQFNKISILTCCVLLGGAVAFSTGCYLGRFVPMKETGRQSIPPPRSGARFLVIYSLAVFPFFYRDLAGLGGSLFSLGELRHLIISSLVSGEKPYSSIITSSAMAISISTTFLVYLEHRKGERLFYLSLLISLLYCILNTGRNSILALVAGLFAIRLFKRGKRVTLKEALKICLPIGTVFAVFMMWYMQLTHKTDEAYTLLDYFLLYLVGGVAGLDIAVDAPDFKHSWVYVPMPTNVFTVYKDFYAFTLPGLVLIFLLIGLMHGVIYKAAKRGSRYGIFFYAASLYPLLMTFFANQYLLRPFARDSLVVLICYLLIPGVRRMLVKLSSGRVCGVPVAAAQGGGGSDG